MTHPTKRLDAHRLVEGVRALTSAETPIVTSKRLKDWFDEEGIDWGGDHKGRTGNLFEVADEACRTMQHLSKWKKNGPKNAPVGWSIPDGFEKAQVWASANGWQHVKV